jgi:hypothetical protein
MESNDRLNLQNDKDIEKIIPFDVGNIKTLTFQSRFSSAIACRR